MNGFLRRLSRPARRAVPRGCSAKALVAGGTSFDGLYVQRKTGEESGYFERVARRFYGRGGFPASRCGARRSGVVTLMEPVRPTPLARAFIWPAPPPPAPGSNGTPWTRGRFRYGTV